MNEASIFIAALDTPPEDREDFLAEACSGDDQLRQRLDALLRADKRPLDILDGSARVLVSSPLPPCEAAGESIGPYRLLDEIGEGGMGIVYVAQQSAPVKRRVAIKVVKPGLDSRQIMARFELEQQSLAMMDHPNIARVFDAGTSTAGRSYFVMELVKGERITKVCERYELNMHDRIELVIAVCHAVQHAHQKGVIHRDIKPSNVLVELQDGKPIPKIIDFGVAKALDERLSSPTLCTQMGQLVGTLEYMSPEQSRFLNLNVDTRTDIYSLGILLYELLTGAPPFPNKRLRSLPLDEVLRVVRDEEPAKPSNNLLPENFSGSGRLSRNRRHVVAELDWIVLKAIEKDPGRRYETAAAFADDLNRFLCDEPITACPPSFAYRTRKFAHRNMRTIIVAALLLAALIAGVIGTSMGLIRARASDQQLRSFIRFLTEDQLELLESIPNTGEVQLKSSEYLWNYWRNEHAKRPNDVTKRFELAVASRQYAEVRRRYGDYRGAEVLLDDAIDLLNELAPLNTEQRFALYQCYDLRVTVRATLGNPHGAVADGQTAIRIIEKLHESHPHNSAYNASLAFSHEELARIHHQMGNVSEQGRHRTEVSQILKDLKESGLLTDLTKSSNYGLMLSRLKVETDQDQSLRHQIEEAEIDTSDTISKKMIRERRAASLRRHYALDATRRNVSTTLRQLPFEFSEPLCLS